MLETVYLGGNLEGKSRKWWFESIWGPKGAPYGQKRGDFGGFGAPPGGAPGGPPGGPPGGAPGGSQTFAGYFVH